jgi:hypothetical protein
MNTRSRMIHAVSLERVRSYYPRVYISRAAVVIAAGSDADVALFDTLLKKLTRRLRP